MKYQERQQEKKRNNENVETSYWQKNVINAEINNAVKKKEEIKNNKDAMTENNRKIF